MERSGSLGGQLQAVVLRRGLGAVGALFNDSTLGGLCLLSELTVVLSVNLWVYEAGLARTKRPQQNAGALGLSSLYWIYASLGSFSV